MGYYLYVIRSGDSQYIGVTGNVKERLKRHNLGYNKSTKHKKDWKLIHFEKFDTISEARCKETAMKKAKKRYGAKKFETSGRGSARLEHLLGVQGVDGSNPSAPTN
jgi:putative endonuclease